MRNVIYSQMVSRNGFIEGPSGELDWAVVDEELHQHFNDLESTIDAHLYGRRLYENMAAYWPTAEENPSAPTYEVEYARIGKTKPKVVFSRTLTRVDWNSRLVRDNVAEEIANLKQQPGKDLSLGGANLASTIIQFGLVDEYWMYVNPMVLGGGKSMFPAIDKMLCLRLVETRTFGCGVVLLRYSNGDERR
jgi:dihydrofolate reductase